MTRILLLLSIISFFCNASQAQQRISLKDFKPLSRWLIMKLADLSSGIEVLEGTILGSCKQFEELKVLDYLHNTLKRGSIIVDGGNDNDQKVKNFLKEIKKYTKNYLVKGHVKLAIHKSWKSGKDVILNEHGFNLYPVGRLLHKVLCEKEKYSYEEKIRRKNQLLNFLEMQDSKKLVYNVLNGDKEPKRSYVELLPLCLHLREIETTLISERAKKSRKNKKKQLRIANS